MSKFAKKKRFENHGLGFYAVVLLGEGKTESITVSHPKIPLIHLVRHATATIADDYREGNKVMG